MDGEPLGVDTRKATALLAYLAVRAGPQSRDLLVDLLWPDPAARPRPGGAPAHALDASLGARTALGHRHRTAVVLDAEPDAVDVGRFRGLVAGAGDGAGRDRAALDGRSAPP